MNLLPTSMIDSYNYTHLLVLVLAFSCADFLTFHHERLKNFKLHGCHRQNVSWLSNSHDCLINLQLVFMEILGLYSPAVFETSQA
jgi:hypothetical protein